MQFIKKVFLLFLFYTLIFRPEFVFVPISINTFFGLLGAVVYFADKKARKNISHFTLLAPFGILKYAIPFVIAAFISVVANHSSDFFFLRYGISIVLGFFAAYFIAYVCYGIYGEMTVDIVIKYLMVSQIIFLGLGLVFFFNRDLLYIIFEITRLDADNVTYTRVEGTRLISLGENFFGAGVINGFILLVMAMWISTRNMAPIKESLLIVYFFVTLAIGMMSARTTMMGALIGIIILLLYKAKKSKTFLKNLLAIVLSIMILIPVSNYFLQNQTAEFGILRSFGFEMFDNYEETGEFSTSSSDKMLGFYDIVPDNLATWVLGDAKWTDGKGGYYKHTDAGYFRCIFYFGCVGLFCMLIYYFKCLDIIFNKKGVLKPIKKTAVWAIFVYVLILNIKGFADLYFLIIPFYFCCRNGGAKEKEIVVLIK